MPRAGSVILACGALAHELVALKAQIGWDDLKIRCLPANLHNRPERIASKLEPMIQKALTQYENVLIGYAECGSGGEIDALARRYSLERLPGAHCYEFFAGSAQFAALHEQNIGTFYLTDFLAQHFEALMVRGFKLDSHPELKEMLFKHYSHMVYLAQTHSPKHLDKAQYAADWLGVPLEVRHTGYGQLQTSVVRFREVAA